MISLNNKAVRYYSILNPWIDFIIVPDDEKKCESIAEFVERKMEEWFEKEINEAFGEWIENLLDKKLNGEYEIFYIRNREE